MLLMMNLLLLSVFLTDYTFSGEELWDGSTTGLTTITLSGITQDADYNDVTITQKPITISGHSGRRQGL